MAQGELVGSAVPPEFPLAGALCPVTAGDRRGIASPRREPCLNSVQTGPRGAEPSPSRKGLHRPPSLFAGMGEASPLHAFDTCVTVSCFCRVVKGDLCVWALPGAIRRLTNPIQAVIRKIERALPVDGWPLVDYRSNRRLRDRAVTSFYRPHERGQSCR